MNSKGDRDGGDAQREKILNRVIAFAKGTGQIPEVLFWQIYRTCVSRTVMTKMPELQKLLLEVKHPSENTSTASIFDTISKTRSAYKVPQNQIRELYLLWGFQRDQSVENALSASAATVIDEAQMSSIEEKIGDIKILIQKESELRASLIGRERAFTEGQIEKVEEKIQEVSEESSKGIAGAQKQIVHVQKSIDNLRGELKSLPDKKYVKSIKEEVENIQKQIKQLRATLTSLEEAQALQNRELGRVNEKIGRKFLAATNSSNKTLRKVGSGKNQMPEIEFIQHWQSRLSETTFHNLGLDDLLAIHLFFKNFKCFIVQGSELFDTWVATLGWQQLTQMCVAEPSWYKSDQCAALQSFVHSEDSPNILKIANFNHALPEGYLFPLVLPWSQREEFVDRKLVLITGPSSLEGLKESAQHFPFLQSSSGKLDPSPILSGHRNLNASSSVEQFFISTLSVWPTETRPLYHDNRELLNLLGTQNIELPPFILRNYTQFRAVLEVYFDYRSAILTSFQLIIQPWLQHCQNEIYAEQVMQNLKVVYG